MQNRAAVFLLRCGSALNRSGVVLFRAMAEQFGTGTLLDIGAKKPLRGMAFLYRVSVALFSAGTAELSFLAPRAGAELAGHAAE